jgi:UDP-N-acetyl-2-amino-2-deoxyglucuronate dehydrogenase
MPVEAHAPLRIALVGCGRIAESHLDAIAAEPELAKLVAVVDADPTRARTVAGRRGAVRAFTTLSDALALNDIDAVVLTTPNALHSVQAIAALEAGKHVLVEKPMAENGADARAMAQAAERAGRILAVGHTFRHGAAVRYLQDHRAGFGRLRAIEMSQCFFWDGPQAPWWATRTPEESLILSLYAPHPLDFVQLVMGDADPLRVHVEAARHQGGWQAEDEAMILLAYADRCLVTLHISYNQPQVVDRRTLFFDKGVLRIEDGEYLYWNEELLVEPSPGVITDARSMSGRDLSGYFRTQLAEFVAATRGQPHRSPLHGEGRRLIDLIDRVRASARANSADLIDGPAEAAL